MRTYLLLMAVYGSLPFIPFFPFYGILVFSWLAYMRPQNMAYGVGATRLSYYVAVAAIGGLVVAVIRGREKLMTVRPQTIILIALFLWMGLATTQAFNYERALKEFTLFRTVLIISLMTTGLALTLNRIRLLLLVISGSIGFLAFKYAIFGLARGGVRYETGPGGFMKDNNDFAVALNMALPLLLGILIYEKNRIAKGVAGVLAASCVITTVFTFSRGGLLSLIAVTCLILIRTKRTWMAVLALALGTALLVNLTPESYQEMYLSRAETISVSPEDSSAATRIEMWKIAFVMSLDYPLFGVGPNNFMEALPNYRTGSLHVAHNTLMQLLSEAGYPAALLWLSLIGVTLLRLESLRRSDVELVAVYAGAFQISIVGYVVGSMFLDKALFDLFYQLVAMSVCLEVVAESLTDESPAEIPIASNIPWWRQRPATTNP